MPSHRTLKLIIPHWIMTLAFCGQTLFQKIRASYPVFENEGTGHQRVPPFSCLFSPWNNEMRLLGCPAAALAEGSEWSTAGKGIHTRIWGDLLCLGTLDTSGMLLGKNGWVGGLPALMAASSKVKGARRGWEGCLDWLGLHPFLSPSRTPQ